MEATIRSMEATTRSMTSSRPQLLFFRASRLVCRPHTWLVVPRARPRHASHTAAAKELGLTEGSLKARLLAARRALYALSEPIVPPSQRGPA
jgi:hypothetical protein